MSLIQGIKDTIRKHNRPTEWIEAVVVFTTMLSISAIIFTDADYDVHEPVVTLFKDHETFTALAILMVPVAVAHIIAIVTLGPERSLSLRAYFLFVYALVYMFISVLTLVYVGPDHLIWVYTGSIAWISAILYLNLKVNGHERGH